MNSLSENFRIWEGIQENWPEDRAEEGFRDAKVVERIKEQMQSAIEACRNGQPNPLTSIYNQYPLPLLIAFLAAEKPVSVLDFGGGLAQTYLATRATVTNLKNVIYYVLEFGSMARVGRNIFPDDAHVNFIESFEAAPGSVDIVHAGSSFQYVDDWKSLLERFASLKPRYIAFGNLLAGDIRPCVTFQNYWSHRIPVRFHNFREVMDVLEELGYRLIFDAYHEQTILGAKQPLPLQHFPDEHRLIFGRNVILMKS